MAMTQYRARRAGYGAALARGVKYAYDNRKAAWEVGQAFKKMTVSAAKKKASTTKTTGNGRSYAGGNDFTSSKRTIRPKKKTMRAKVNMNTQIIKGMTHNEVYRFQNITRYDTNTGGLVLRQGFNTTSNQVYSPVHIYDISAFNNQSATVAGYQLGWTSQAVGADVMRIPLQSQNSSGAGTAITWVTENNATNGPFPKAQRALHNWTSVGINFYGPRVRTTWFEVTFMTIRQEFADLFYASNSNPSAKLLLQYLERPLIYSNLQTDVGGQGANMFKVVRRFKYYVSASQTTDVDTSVGKIKEAKIFMRHDRLRDYHWQHNDFGNAAVLPHGVDDGIDFVRDDDVHNTCAHNKRLFMVIRAFAPERTDFLNDADLSVNPNKDPTYDIVIRNSYRWTLSPNQSN